MKTEKDLTKNFCSWCNTETYWVVLEPNKPISEIRCIEHGWVNKKPLSCSY